MMVVVDEDEEGLLYEEPKGLLLFPSSFSFGEAEER